MACSISLGNWGGGEEIKKISWSKTRNGLALIQLSESMYALPSFSRTIVSLVFLPKVLLFRCYCDSFTSTTLNLCDFEMSLLLTCWEAEEDDQTLFCSKHNFCHCAHRYSEAWILILNPSFKTRQSFGYRLHVQDPIQRHTNPSKNRRISPPITSGFSTQYQCPIPSKVLTSFFPISVP